ncbi:MAG: ATP-dependent helicase IRC3 [Lentisphaeria bacterium]|jgi:ATP-dependent helicase IRC3
MKLQPRPYQNTAVDEVYTRYKNKHRKLLLYLPTGAGKTVIASLIIEKLLEQPNFGKVLFIAHREEILDQTVKTLKNNLSHISIDIEQGKRSSEKKSKITVASVQSLITRKEKFNPKEFSLIICDECHRALSPSWTEVIQHFHNNGKPDTLLLGMTATPQRTDGRSAVTIFNEIAFEISRAELQDLGFLVPMHYYTVQTKLGLDKVKMNAGDFQVKALSTIMNYPEVRALTLRAWQEKGAEKKTIVFCAGVEHAHQIAKDMTNIGVNAAAIDGKTQDRKLLLSDFQKGKIQVLTNYGVLTEGFDDPTVECILLARPTTSPLVYNQCVGRGLRIAPSKSACVVIDIIDRSTNQLQYGASELAGLPKKWQSKGRDPFRENNALKKIKVTSSEAFLHIRNAECLEEVQSILMSLPPEIVTAGLDGEPVLHYAPSETFVSTENARKACIALLKQASARFKDLTIEEGTIQISFHSPEINNERFEYLQWHLQRISNRTIFYKKPLGRKVKPKVLLQSMVSKTHKLKNFDFNEKNNTVSVLIEGLTSTEIDQVSSNFYNESGMHLDLIGQLSLL